MRFRQKKGGIVEQFVVGFSASHVGVGLQTPLLFISSREDAHEIDHEGQVSQREAQLQQTNKCLGSLQRKMFRLINGLDGSNSVHSSPPPTVQFGAFVQGRSPIGLS